MAAPHALSVEGCLLDCAAPAAAMLVSEWVREHTFSNANFKDTYHATSFDVAVFSVYIKQFYSVILYHIYAYMLLYLSYLYLITLELYTYLYLPCISICLIRANLEHFWLAHFVLIFCRCPPKSIKKYHFCSKFIWRKKAKCLEIFGTAPTFGEILADVWARNFWPDWGTEMIDLLAESRYHFLKVKFTCIWV